MLVTLSDVEWRFACSVGCERNIASIRAGRKVAHGIDLADRWRSHIEGACGECAVAKALGIFWTGSVDSFKRADLGGRLQVRTASRATGELIVRDDDNPEHVYILVVGEAPTFRVCGWLYGWQAAHDDYRKAPHNRPAAYFVPQAHLTRLDELRTVVKEPEPI
jgi:hypothetical protein